MWRSLALLAVAHALFATLQADEISFLRVHFRAGELRVIDHQVAPGHLQPQPQTGGLAFELIGRNTSERTLYRARLDLPTRLEYPLENGQIGSLPLPESEFVIRAPYLAEARSLRLVRPRQSNHAPQSQNESDVLAQADIPPPIRQLRAFAVEPGTKFHTLLTNGPTANRLNIVVFGDGFQAHEETLFTNRAAALIDRFLGTSPYSAFPTSFNGYAIFTPSPESGSDIPSKNIFRDTYFNSSFESFGIERLLTIPPNNFNFNWTDGRGKVFDLLARFMPAYSITVLLVNDTTYGGSGGVPAIASLNSSSAEIALHELGHSFAGLGDEYETPASYPDLEEPNTTRETRRESIKWNSWILDSTPVPTPATATYSRVVGLFEGAHYHATGWYRPKLTCKMRSLGVPFCEVCSEALVLASYSRLNLIESVHPQVRIVLSSIEDPARLAFTLLPGSPTLHFEWQINSAILPVQTPHLDLADYYLTVGDHPLTLHATETTPFVRTDPGGVLKETQNWTIRVLSSRVPELTGRADPDRVTFESTAHAQLVIETSLDFQNWAPIATNSAANQIQAPILGGGTGFYRAVARPLF